MERKRLYPYDVRVGVLVFVGVKKCVIEGEKVGVEGSKSLGEATEEASRREGGRLGEQRWRHREGSSLLDQATVKGSTRGAVAWGSDGRGVDEGWPLLGEATVEALGGVFVT